jgi:hypothetical protein
MKKYSILLIAILVSFSLSGMEPEGEQPKGNQNFWQNFKFEGIQQNSKKFFEQLNNKFLTVSTTLQEKYPNTFNRFKFGQTTEKKVPVDDMRKIVFGTATDYEEVQVTFKKLVLPWYKKSPFKLAAFTAGFGFFVGTVFGWKVRSFFGPKKQKVTEE